MVDTYDAAVALLTHIFELLNTDFFESALSMPTITIQTRPNTFGHFSLWPDSWVSDSGNTHEINIAAGSLARPIEEVVTTLLHEMVHYWNCVHDIKDCSRSGTYHNKKFKIEAEKRGLRVEKVDKYGWALTYPSDKIQEFVERHNLPNISVHRNEDRFYVRIKTSKKAGEEGGSDGKEDKGDKRVKKPSSTRKYMCPCCGDSVRATKVVKIMCIKCQKELLPA